MKNEADKYIDDVLRRVVLPAARKESLRLDLREHFVAADEGHEPVAEVIRRLGDPEEVAASFMEGAELDHAGAWPRLFALVADFGLCCLAMAPALVLVLALAHARAGEADRLSAFLLFVLFVPCVLAGFGVFILYFPIFEHFFGWTPGKKLMKMRVVSEKGAPISLGAAFIRRLPFYFELIWLDGIFAIFTEKKQRAFDIVARTLVVNEPDGGRNAFHYLLCLLPWMAILFALALFALAGGFTSS